MAFNPFVTFQKNRRFWMATILMICMVTFVFCTGGMADERWTRWLRRGSPTVFRYTDPNAWVFTTRNVSQEDLANLKMQRNFANEYAMTCSEMAFRRLTKIWFDEQNQLQGGKLKPKEEAERRSELIRIQLQIETIALRKSKQRYFEGGVKFDDLVEFRLWLAEADRLGIRLEDDHVVFLFRSEFFDTRRDQPLIKGEEYSMAERQAMRNITRGAGASFVMKALADEYRVRIAQYAVIGAQPFSYIARGRGKEDVFTLKFIDPDIPDEMRAPMTLAQVYDFYNKKRAAFDVALVPFKIEDFAKDIKDVPNQQQRKEFFDLHKNLPADPSAEEWGLERPAQVKLEWLIADPDSPGYKDLARLLVALKTTNPMGVDPSSALMTVAGYGAAKQKHLIDVARVQDTMISNITRRGAAYYSEKDFTTPILHRLAQKHPEAIASLFGGLSGASGFSPLDVPAATAGYLAWGTIKHEAGSKVYGSNLAPKDIYLSEAQERAKNPAVRKGDPIDELALAIESEIRRRTPAWNKNKKTFDNSQYIDFLSWTTTGNPFTMITPFMGLDKREFQPLSIDPRDSESQKKMQELGRDHNDDKATVLLNGGVGAFRAPLLTTETLLREIEDKQASVQAEEWAQSNIRRIKGALDAAAGDAEKYKKALNTNLKDLKLAYGPPADKKATWYTRYNVETAPELEPLRKAFEEYVNRINWYEGRDLKPETMLKPTDFYKMFFDTEKFAAVSPFRAATWPPIEVQGNTTRIWKRADPRLLGGFDDAQQEAFKNEILAKGGIEKPVVPFDLFTTAPKPILFWRTAEAGPLRFENYDKLQPARDKLLADIAVLEKDLKTNDKDAIKRDELAKKQGELADLDNVEKRIDQGWKFERARNTTALTAAKERANKLIGELRNAGDNEGGRSQIFTGLPQSKILLSGMSLLHAESFGNLRDYGKYSLPKDKIEYPRDDMVDQALKLVDLKEPIKIQRKKLDGKEESLDPADAIGRLLDELNKELFEQTKSAKPGYAVQVLTNKPRSVFYVAFLAKQPKADEQEMRAAFVNARSKLFVAQRDLFVQRAQEEHAKAMRADYINNLRSSFSMEEVDKEARKTFDERGAD